MAEKELALLDDPTKRKDAELLQQQLDSDVRHDVELARMQAALGQQDAADVYAAQSQHAAVAEADRAQLEAAFAKDLGAVEDKEVRL